MPEFGPPAAPLGKSATIEQRRARQQFQAGQMHELVAWWLDRMVAARDGFPERMTWFWHGHFATSAQKVQTPQMMAQQNTTLRQLGRGDFRVLARAMITDPAMLVWLDGQGNNLKHPNENLAREFMELFTLGVGNYTEDDVRQAARALTGWHIDKPTVTARFDPEQHDSGPETLLGSTTSLDAPGFTDLVLNQPVAPKLIARRIWTRFVADTPPDPATMDRLVRAYGPTHDIRAMLSEALVAPAFHDPASSIAKEPVLWLVGAMRALGVAPTALPEQILRGTLTALGQVPLYPPNVGGWPAGAPWLTTSAALARLRIAQTLVKRADLGPIAATAPGVRIDAVAAQLGLTGFTDRTVEAMRAQRNDPAAQMSLALVSPEYTVSA